MFAKIYKLLKIYHNIYIKNKYFHKKHSYSINGEDLRISQFFKNKKKGFYVDVGSYHPLRMNNTYLLYKKNWTGINIDPSQFSIDLFNFLRPEDLNLQIAVSDKDGEISFFYQKKFSQLNTTDKKIANENFQENFKERQVKCQTIHNILTNSKYKDVKIDFLNIDVEGAEMKVLKTLNFKIYDPKVICIEILGYRELNPKERENRIKNDDIYKYLVGKDYKKVWSGSSYCSHLFIKN